MLAEFFMTVTVDCPGCLSVTVVCHPLLHAISLESHMKIAAALLAAVATAAFILLPSTPALAAGHRIQIYEIYYNSPGTDSLGGMVDSCRYTGTSAGYVFC
jgi:hypothetical protein